MNLSAPASQRGLSFSGFLLGAFIFVMFSLLGMKLIPAYMENAQIKKIFNDISNDPDMQKATVRDVRGSFDHRARIDNISAISSGDITMENRSGKPILNASYYVKIPLAGNVSLYLDFNPTSAGG